MSRRPASRRAKWFWIGVAVVTLANALRLRKLIEGFQTVDVAERTVGPPPKPWRWSSVPGATPAPDATDGIAWWAAERGLEALEVVPRDLGTEEALELARRIDPHTYRDNRLAYGGGGMQIIGASSDVWDRMGEEPRDDLSPIAFFHQANETKRYCLSRADIAVSDQVHAVRRDVRKRRAYLNYRFLDLADLSFASIGFGYLVVAIGLVLTPFWAALALVTWSLQPLVVFLGTPIRPADLWQRSLSRWILEPLDLLRTVTGRWRPDPATDPVPDLDAKRAAYEREYAEGHQHFFEPRRHDCPICGSTRLRARVHHIPDTFQGKPGRFDLDECISCGHVFQNPMLSGPGFAYYYRDFYDGMGTERMQFLFGTARNTNVSRARNIGEDAAPKRWLDVGTGFAQFPLVAQEVLPDTVFDGLDFSDNIEVAERRGWINRGYHGELIDLAPGLAGRYDVVSMHHYLEHTHDPRAELAAAHTVLAPGGLISIEQPNPDSRFGDLLGAYWLNWFQPQHINMIRPDNMVAWLEQAGFDVVRVDHGPWEGPSDLGLAAVTLLTQASFDTKEYPWRPVPTPQARRRARMLEIALAPTVVLGLAADQILGLLKLRGCTPNYRVLARATKADA